MNIFFHHFFDPFSTGTPRKIRNFFLKSFPGLIQLFLSFILCLIISFRSSGQANDLVPMFNRIRDTADKYPVEKVFIQTDKPFYHLGDTMWFKGYVFDASSLTGTDTSGLLYVEIAGANNQVVKTIMTPLLDGLGWGYLNLDEKDFPAGSYTLRAYTNWMRNFDEHRIFKKQFYINDISRKNWMVNSQFNTFQEGNDKVVHCYLRFQQMSGEPATDREVSVELTDGASKVWYKNKFETDVNGTLVFNFRIPDKADINKLTLRVHDLRINETVPEMRVPVILNEPAQADIQFMPEGGDLVAGIQSRVGFKAISEDGKGCNISGIVYNREGKEISDFKSSHLGMGSFNFTPEAGESYVAEVNVGNNHIRKIPLPAAKSSGIVLQIKNPLDDNDSVRINIFSTADRRGTDKPYYLIAESRGMGCYGALVLLNKPVKTLYINKNYFPAGVARIILLNANHEPLCQRLIFIDHHDEWRAHISCKNEYTPEDSVALHIDITDNSGNPVRSDLSMAVTDDGQVELDSAGRISIVSDILLTSDVRGYVEYPGYYFSSFMTEKKWNDLDNLLLTQGWVSYSPKDLQASGNVRYPAQKSYTISGQVTNIFNKPVAGSQVLLLSDKPFTLINTTTGPSGEFSFNNVYPVDNTSYFIQARNKHNKSFGVGIDLNGYHQPVLKPLRQRNIPWYVNVDTNSLKTIQIQLVNREEIDRLQGRHMLKEVVIVGQKVIQGSKNLNGPGGANQVIDESVLKKAQDSTLRQILEKYVKGFHLGGKTLNKYVLFDQTVHLVIDGVNVDFFKPEGENRKLFYDQYLDYLTAKDIKGVEVMKTPRFTSAYTQKYLKDPLADVNSNAFIEITTYSGNGAFLKKTPGVYLFRPLITFNAPARFYSPAYHTKDEKKLIDMRSTIYWDPNVITDTAGKAVVSFYTSSKPGTYTVVMEGSDMNGHIVSMIKKIKVVKAGN